PKPERARDVCGVVPGRVVDHDYLVDQVSRDLGVSVAKRLLRVVGGHHDDDLLAQDHVVRPPPSGNGAGHGGCSALALGCYLSSSPFDALPPWLRPSTVVSLPYLG